MKKLYVLILLSINCLSLLGQNTNAYNEAYQKIYNMLQSGYINPSELQKVYDNLSKEAEKNTATYYNALKKQYADYFFNSAQQKANKNNHVDAISDYESSINYLPSFEAYNSKGCSEYVLGEYADALNSFNKALALNASDQTIIENKESTQKQLLKVELAPISIYDIKLANTDSNGNILTDYGQPIYSNTTMYLKPKIYYKSTTTSKSTLQIKLFKPDGSLSTSNSSPDGYTYNYELLTNGNGFKTLTGWGSKVKGNWSSGKYRLEIWYDNACLASKNFYISNDDYTNTPVFTPIFYPTHSNGNTIGLKLIQKTCSYCKGTGINPIATNVPGYGSTSEHWCSTCNLMVSASHGAHLQCIVCRGSGFIESYEY